jgi:hypothetical protein
VAVGTSFTSSLAYNDANQLLTESYTSGPLDGLSLTTDYDALLRRTAVALSNQTATLTQFGYDNAPRLATVKHGVNVTGYSYLANSPLVSEISFTNSGAQCMVVTKGYDNLNRLAQIASPPSASSAVAFNYAYNSANQRTRNTTADGSFWFHIATDQNGYTGAPPIPPQQ